MTCFQIVHQKFIILHFIQFEINFKFQNNLAQTQNSAFIFSAPKREKTESEFENAE